MARVSTQTPPRAAQSERRKRSRGFLVVAAVLALIVVALAIAARNGPARVAVAQPKLATIRETITGTGTVYGVHETLVGAELNGVVQQLNVRDGDRVARGQIIAVIDDRVVQAQVAEAQANLDTARAQLLQTLKRAPESDARAASEQVTQALAQADQQRAALEQADRGEQQARAQLIQLQSQAVLAGRQFDRAASLYRQGYTSRADYDNAQTQLRVAQQQVAAQQHALESAQAGERAGSALLRSAQANTQTQRARMDTLLAGAQTEDIAVAQKRVAQAQEALASAQRQAENAVVRAPFDGSISAVNAETGQNVGPSGIVQLVSKDLEIRLDVDEQNLGELASGQRAAVSSNAFPGANISGAVTRVGASVDRERGTVTVTITPRAAPSWLRSGQSVNVEILTSAGAKRLLVPESAIARDGDRTVVYVVREGRALEREVMVRPATSQGVPILSGLSANDRVITSAAGIADGTKVRVK